MGCGASTPSQAVQHGSPMQAKDTATSWELVRCSPSGHELFQKHGIPPEIAKEFVDKLGFRKTQHLNLVVEEDIKNLKLEPIFERLFLRIVNDANSSHAQPALTASQAPTTPSPAATTVVANATPAVPSPATPQGHSTGSTKLKERVQKGLEVGCSFLTKVKPMLPFPGDMVAGALAVFMDLVSQAMANKDNLTKLQERAVDLFDLVVDRHVPNAAMMVAGAGATQPPQQHQQKTSDAYMKLMNRFRDLLTELNEYVRVFSSHSWLVRIITSGGDQQRYEDYAQQLRDLTLEAQFAVVVDVAGMTEEMRAAMEEMTQQMVYVDHSAEVRTAVEELGGLDAVMADEDKIKAVAEKLDMGQRLTIRIMKQGLAAVKASVVKEGDKGFHRLIGHMDLRVFWHTFFTGEWKVPWRLWWLGFPSRLEEVHLEPSYVSALCNVLESDQAKQAFQQRVEQWDPDNVSVDEIQLAFPQPDADLLQIVRQLTTGSSGGNTMAGPAPGSSSTPGHTTTGVLQLTATSSSEAAPSHTQHEAMAKCRLPPLDSLYTGRDTDAELVVRLVKEQAAAQRGVCLLGGAGLGKSSLAVDVGWRLAREGVCPGGAYFCDLREARSVDDVLMRIALAVESVITGDDTLLKLLAWLHATSASCGGGVLLVVDNAEDVLQADGGGSESFRDAMAQVSTAAMVLVTSRAPMSTSSSGSSSSNKFIDHPLHGVDDGSSRQLVASLWGDASPLAAGDVDALLDMCQGVPLLLRTCADALAHGRVTLAVLKAALTNTNNDSTTALHLALASLPLSQQLLLAQLSVFPSQFDETSASMVVYGDSSDVSRIRAQLAVLYSHGLVLRNVARSTYSLHMAVRTTAARLGGGLTSAATASEPAVASKSAASNSQQKQQQQFSRALSCARERFMGHIMAAFTEWGQLYMTPDALLALRLARQHAPDFLAVIQMAAAEATTAPKMLELVLRSTTWHLESLLLDVGGVLTPAFYETWSSMETAANDLQAPCLANFYSMLAGEAAHQQALELRTKVLGEEHPDTISSISNLASCINAQGKYSEAEPMYRQALELHTKVLGAEHPDTISSINNLASCIDAQGKYSEAEPMYRQALELRTKVLGAEHPDTISSISYLASCINAQGKYSEAEPMYRQALELRTKVLGEEHPDTISSISNLANCIGDQGKYSEAEPMFRQALELRTKVLGEEHPGTISSISNLASCIYAQGKYSEAEPMYRRALELHTKVLGAEHPDTITSINNLASCIKGQGKYSEAEPMFRQALELRTKVLGEEHPGTISSISNLASCIYAQGKYSEAEPMYRRALELHTKVLGEEHPATISSINNLASCIKGQGKYSEAEPMFRQALELRTKVLGEEHPDTISSISNLAICIGDQGNYSEAEPMYRQALELHTKVLGEEHPGTISSISNLASCIYAQGKYSEAEPMYRQALELFTKVLGAEHPDTISSISNLASCIDDQGNYSEAEPMYRQALELRTKVLGAEHPGTISSISNLASCIYAQGKYSEAEPMYRQALELHTKVLGEEHPDTISSISNLANCIGDQGNYSEAEPMYRQALELHTKVLGEEHPGTISSISNLASCIYAQGKYSEAEPMYRQALELFTKVLGAEHPDTIRSINYLANCINDQGKYSEAEPMFRQALELFTKVLGAEHPDTIRSINDLADCKIQCGRAHVQAGAGAAHQGALRRAP
ncbi:hypothetical protein Agub_g2856 [Astrephomene gubernaculifera]|uniref:TPR-like protein n=1 Tax=Astrephomene gubernaculifera TaxID=47775 RepID=A0AAD3DHQ9_9CHLO|nr:hypothetical protein Agub_g2856 [Astrephomene gubernaculifera]